MNNFKENLRVLKEIHKVTKNKELAEKLNISVSAIDGWVRRKKIPAKYMIQIDKKNKKYEAGYEAYIEEISNILKYLNPKCTYDIYWQVKSFEEHQNIYGRDSFNEKRFNDYPSA